MFSVSGNVAAALAVAGVASAMLAYRVVSGPSLPKGPSVDHWFPMVFGHRGCRKILGTPENTIPAFEYAVANGATGVECDVRMTKDGHIVVIHDNILGRELIPAAKGDMVSGLTLAQVKELSYKVDGTSTIRIPTLEELVIWCEEKGVKLLIELKEVVKPVECVVELLRLYQKYPTYMYAHTLVISFLPGPLYEVRKRDGKIPVCMLHSGLFYRGLVLGGIDTPEWYVKMAPTLCDYILQWYAMYVAPSHIGVSTMGPKYTLFNEAYRSWCHKQNMSVYCWGFDDIHDLKPLMLTAKCSVSCDDDFQSFTARLGQ